MPAFRRACIVSLVPQAATQETAEVGRIDHGEWLGGEALFIPKRGDTGGEEDNGFLISFVSPKDCGNSGKEMLNRSRVASNSSCRRCACFCFPPVIGHCRLAPPAPILNYDSLDDPTGVT